MGTNVKRFIVLLSALILLISTHTANAAETSWYPGVNKSPAYPRVPVIEVVDAVRPTFISDERRKQWTQRRNDALAEWAVSGLVFDVRVGAVPPWPYCYTGTITYTLGDLGAEGWGNASGVGGWFDYYNCGSARFDEATLKAIFEGNVLTTVRKLIEHETGHTLGFGHGGCGIMAWGYFECATGHTSEEEIQLVKRYYDL